MKTIQRVVSIIMLLFAILTGIMAALLHEKDIALYERVADAYSYVGVIIISIFISFYLLEKVD